MDIELCYARSQVFGSAKNFYCCRFDTEGRFLFFFGSAKNFYCCRSYLPLKSLLPLEVLRISTVVDNGDSVVRCFFGSAKNFYCCRLCYNKLKERTLEVLRISTVVD